MSDEELSDIYEEHEEKIVVMNSETAEIFCKSDHAHEIAKKALNEEYDPERAVILRKEYM